MMNVRDLNKRSIALDENTTEKENREFFSIPNEASCSAEFPQGCLFSE